jgi:hypothetical protein
MSWVNLNHEKRITLWVNLSMVEISKAAYYEYMLDDLLRFCFDLDNGKLRVTKSCIKSFAFGKVRL